MRLPSTPTLAMVDHLNTEYFNTVWNATKDHGRVNFALPKAAVRVQTGAIPVGQSVVGLPTTDQVYAVYRVSPRLFGRGITFTPNTWMTDTQVLSLFGTSLIAYSAVGRCIPPGQIALYYDQYRAQVLVAIGSAYTTMCIGTLYPDLYMTTNTDTTRATPVQNQVFRISSAVGSVVTPSSVTMAIANAKAQCPAGTIVYVNGWLYDPLYVPPLSVGDIVVITVDPDIAGYCDITIDDNQTGYFSTKFSEYREILHVPKIINPTNIVITTDTVVSAIFDVSTNRGVYGHRVDPHSLESIGHNDFSMSRTTLQAFQNGLGAQSIRVRLYVRFATRPVLLGQDANHMADLYTLTDAEIKLQLIGLSLNQIGAWKAANLEQSPYLGLLYAFNGFSISDVLSQYTAAMGYYDVASTLSQSMHYYTYQGAQVEILKPARLIGYACQVIVYADGRKVPEATAVVSDYTSKGFLLGFEAGSYVTVGARIAVYVCESNLRTPQVFNPSVGSGTITLDSDDYTLVEVVPYTTPQAVWQGTTQKGYRTIPVSRGDYSITTNTDGSATFAVAATHFNSNLYLIPNAGMHTALYPIDSILAAKQAIILPVQITDSAGVVIPMVGYNSLEVYLNGYRLIEDLDYRCTPVPGANNDILQLLLEVSNQNYLKLGTTGNAIEVVTHGGTVVSRDRGYSISNMLNRTTPPMIWSASAGRVFVRGVLVEHVSEIGNIVTATDSLVDGSPYLLEWTLPYGVAKLMAAYSPNTDITLRTNIDRVLGLIPFTYPTTVLIHNLYALYSPYITQIISDVIAGTFTIANDAKDDQFLQQFSPYALLYPRDPTIGAANSLLYRQFLTLAASYANYTVPDPQQMLMVQRLIRLLLTPSNLSLNQVLL